jgi:hypothetical protein
VKSASYVLIVCYDFPLISAAGVIRTYQVAKRLPDFAWQPIILSTQTCGDNREHNIEFSDGELPCPKITAGKSRFAVPVRMDRCALSKPGDAGDLEGNNGMHGLVRMAGQLAVPDGKIGWFRPAVKSALQIASSYPVRMCFSVSPRPTAHLVGYRVARLLKIPWVADFVLPWSDAYWLTGRPRPVAWLDQRLERFVIRRAHRVTVAYAELARRIAIRYGRASQEKTTVIPTGFEEELFTAAAPSLAPKFTVVYPGNHFCEQGRGGAYFLQAIDEWITRDPSLEQKVEFIFIGKRDDELLRRRAVMAHPQVIRILPLMSHRACIEAVLASHLCVVNTVGNRIPAKVYECMRAGKWILALADPGSDLENLICDYSKGASVPAHDMSAIQNALQTILQRSRSDKSDGSGDERFLSMYSSSRSAEMLSHTFENLLLKPFTDLSDESRDDFVLPKL